MIVQIDTDVVYMAGANAAIVYGFISDVVNLYKYSSANCPFERMVDGDGRTWVKLSAQTISKNIFRCLTEKQVRTALYNLSLSELIETRNFGKNAMDRTNWYAICSEEL